MPNSSIENEKMYEDLRKEGNSKQKSARISFAAAAQGKSLVARKGGESGSYDNWTAADLKKRAKDLGLSGYSDLTKSKLISKIRNSWPLGISPRSNSTVIRPREISTAVCVAVVGRGVSTGAGPARA